MKKLIRTAAALFCAALCFALMAAAAPAEDIAGGVSGTCSWRITSEGELIISPANGTEGTLEPQRRFQWYSYSQEIKSVRFIGTVYADSVAYMFQNCANLKAVDFTGLDTSKVTSMYGVFDGCSSLTSLDLSGWDTSNVTSMSDMFDGCSSLTSLDLSGWDTSNVTSISSMFRDCRSLAFLNLSGWDTSNVTDMDSLFYNCSIDSLDLTGWDLSNVANAKNIFNSYNTFVSINTSNWVLPQDSSMLFLGLNSLASLDISGWDTSNVTNMDRMFLHCSALTSLDLSGWDTSNVTNMWCMFSGCSSLTSLDVSGWNVSKVTRIDGMFKDCKSLTSLDLAGWNISNVADVKDLFSDCRSLSSLNVADWALPSNISSLFSGLGSLISLDLSGWDTSKVTNMGSMFFGCSSLASLDLSGWDTSKVTDMGSMFYGCKSLTSLDLSGWRTSNVTSMRAMFSGCSLLISLDLSDLDTSKVTNMYGMFSGCDEIRQITFGSAFDCQNKNHLFAPDISMLHVTRGGQDISALGEIRNFRDFEDMSPAELEGTWIRTMTLGGSGAEDSAVTDIIKVLRYEGMTQKDTNEPTGRGYAPTNVAALPVFSGSSPMSFSDANAAKAAECLSRLRAERFTAEGYSAAEVSEDADSGDLLLRDGAQTLLRLSLQRGANGTLELAFTSYAPGAVRITLDGREYLVVTPGDVNLDGEIDANDWANVMRWALEAPSKYDTKPDDPNYTVKINGKNCNLWILLADVNNAENVETSDEGKWTDMVDANDWSTLMYLTLEAWKQ